MKFPEWLPDAKHTVRPEGGAPMKKISRLTDTFIRFFHVEAAGFLAGIGFTMSLLIGGLALVGEPPKMRSQGQESALRHRSVAVLHARHGPLCLRCRRRSRSGATA